MAKICENCGRACEILGETKLSNGSIICDKCFHFIVDKNANFKSDISTFAKNISIITLEEFKNMYANPQLATKFDTNEYLLVSPFRIELAEHELHFLKQQLWVSYVKKKIETTVLVYNGGLDITEKTSTVNTKVINYFLSMEDIQEYKASIHMMKFPLILLLLVVFFYGIDIWAILLILLLLWWSYGKEIMLKTKEGKVYKIPVNSHTEEVDKLLTIIKDYKECNEVSLENLSQNVDSMLCTSCGKSISANANFCKYCGAKVK